MSDELSGCISDGNLYCNTNKIILEGRGQGHSEPKIIYRTPPPKMHLHPNLRFLPQTIEKICTEHYAKRRTDSLDGQCEQDYH